MTASVGVLVQIRSILISLGSLSLDLTLFFKMTTRKSHQTTYKHYLTVLLVFATFVFTIGYYILTVRVNNLTISNWVIEYFARRFPSDNPRLLCRIGSQWQSNYLDRPPHSLPGYGHRLPATKRSTRLGFIDKWGFLEQVLFLGKEIAVGCFFSFHSNLHLHSVQRKQT